MVARSFGGTPCRRPTSPSIDARRGRGASVVGSAIRDSSQPIIPRLDAPFSRDFVSFTHTRARRYANKTCIACPNPVKPARLDPASRRRPFCFVSKLFRVSRARAVHRDVRGKEDASDAELIDVRPSCARIERASRATPAEERANTASVGSSAHPYRATRVCVERCRR